MEEEFEKRLEAIKAKIESVKKGREEIEEIKQAISELRQRQNMIILQLSELQKNRENYFKLEERVERLNKIVKEILSIFEKYVEMVSKI
jgi:hypothetical protein